MSSDETKSALSRAFELVEAGRYDDARALLDPILAADKNNADAWWIYAHAVTSPEDGTEALQNVLRINPRYPGAQELLGQAQQLFSDKPPIKQVTTTTPAATIAAPASFPEEFPETQAEKTARSTQEQKAAAAAAPRKGLPIPWIAGGGIAAAVIIVLLLLTQGGGTTTPTATGAVVAPTLIQATDAGAGAITEEPTVSEATGATTTEVATTEGGATVQVLPSQTTEAVVPTEAPTEAATTAPTAVTGAATTEAAAAPTDAANDVTTAAPTTAGSASTPVDYPAIEQTLSASFPIAESGVGQVETSFGNTLLVTVCTTPGREMRALLPQVMNALAKETTTLSEDVAAIGVRMVNCETNTPLLTVATGLATAQAYAGGSLTDGTFAATWKPQENS